MADGSVLIDVGLDTNKAEKDLTRLKQKIAKLETDLDKDTGAKEGILRDLAAANAELDAATERVRYLKDALKTATGDKKVLLRDELDEALAEQRAWNKEAGILDTQYNRVKERIEKNTQKLSEMKEEAGKMAQALEAARPTERLAESIETAKSRLTRFVRTAFGIATVAALFKKLKASIVDAVAAYAEHDAETKANIEGLKSALAALQLSWGAAFAPILNAVAPILQKLIGWLTEAANAVARFLAILGGKTTYKKAISNNTAMAGSLAATGAAAEKAEAQLASFDDLDILHDNKSNGNGGGSGGGAGSGIEMIEEAVDAFDGSFLSNLALSVKDVLFTWKDLNPEQIAEKIIAGLGMVLGAALGITLGLAPGGILLLTLGGLAFGLIADALIFDHDGVISQDEALKMIALACAGLLGGVIGFQVGLVPGALLGAMISMGIVMLITSTQFAGGNGDTKETWLDKIRTFLHFPSDKQIIDFFKVKIWDEGIVAAFKEVLTLITGKDFAAPTESGASLADQIIEGLGTFGDKFSKFWNESVKPWFTAEKWRELGKEAMQGIKNGLNSISLPKFHFYWETTGYTGSFFGRTFTVNIPFPHLDWYAKGGVFNAASVIGVGENGQEAVVPLEHNTEWINKVVDGVIDRLSESSVANALADAFASTPLPAMAGGTVTPPNSTTAADALTGINDTLQELRALLSGAGGLASETGNEYRFYLDGKELHAVIQKYDRRYAVAQGR